MKQVVKPQSKQIMSIHKPINREAVNKDSIEGLTRDKDKKVFGTFVNIECQGQPAKISGKYYPGMEYFSKTFEDNEKATIPLSVARWINERCYHETHTTILDEEGKPIKNPVPKFRYKFIVEHIAA